MVLNNRDKTVLIAQADVKKKKNPFENMKDILHCNI